MSILDDMGLDPETFTWHSLALCNNIDDPELFFDKYESDKTVARQVDDMCLHCPVMKQCAETGMQDGLQGVWGGVYWNGSGRPDQNRNDHKTPEVWDEIKERLSE